jgi:peptidoglycan/xylan/chitin deacetylase (PgdA/CDA1 family)
MQVPLLRALSPCRLLCAILPLVLFAAATVQAQQTPTIRFILTFDDGPYGRVKDNPTVIILDALADNPTQRGIKAIFFVQTRSSDGATALGQALIRREHAEGHLVALHDGSPWGHRSHPHLSDAELERSLSDGVADLLPVLGHPVTLLRPPYWAYDARTLGAYARHNLVPLLTDISANDGKDWGFKASPRRFIHMRHEMENLRARIYRAELPEIDGAMPVVVTFHDTNTYTADHMREYLQMLVDEARAAGLPVAPVPFYDNGAVLERTALVRARDLTFRADMVPWWWRWIDW